MATRAYKFLKMAHAEQMLARGRVAIGTLASYAKDDGICDGRNDPHEGRRIYQPGAVTLPATELAHLFDFPVYPGVSFAFQKETIFDFQMDGYVYCMADSINRDMVHRMETVFGYDACVKIKDVERFCKLVTDADKRLQVAFNNSPSFWGCGWVKYKCSTPRENIPDNDAWCKRPQFKWQREIRTVWAGAVPREPFLIDAPAIVPLLTLVDLAHRRR